MRIGIIGLGYVGLPLAVEFGNKMTTDGAKTTRHKYFANGVNLAIAILHYTTKDFRR